MTTGEDRGTVVYRGATYGLCEPGCAEVWRKAEQARKLDPFVEAVEPRGALFQGDSNFLNPVYQQANPMSRAWMNAGLWITLAVVSAGLAAALAVGSGRPVALSFVLGLVLPGLGLALTPLLPKRRLAFALRGTKIPLTRDVSRCPSCGHTAHPAATRCPGCGSTLQPTEESEVARSKR
jgi:hypothetical protein